MTRESTLEDMLSRRLTDVDARARLCLGSASQVIVFGSVSAGLETAHSDLDVLCVGEHDYKFKNRFIELLCLGNQSLRSTAWLQGELASHIAAYGIWLKGNNDWTCEVHIGPVAIEKKHRRVRAFLEHLSEAWPGFQPCFKKKYAIKVRRETQRLILLERGVPIPPTAILDYIWDSFPKVRARVWSFLDSVRPTLAMNVLTELKKSGLSITSYPKRALAHPNAPSIEAALRSLQPESIYPVGRPRHLPGTARKAGIGCRRDQME